MSSPRAGGMYQDVSHKHTVGMGQEKWKCSPESRDPTLYNPYQITTAVPHTAYFPDPSTLDFFSSWYMYHTKKSNCLKKHLKALYNHLQSSLPGDVQLNLFWQKEELMIVSLLTYCRMSTFIFTSTFQSDFSRKMGAVGKRKSESPAGLSGKRPLPSGQVSKLWVSHRTEPLYNLTWWLEDSPFSPSPAGWFKHPCLADCMVYSLFWSSTTLSRELPVSSRPLWSVLLHLVQSWAKPHQCWCDPNWLDIVNTWFCGAPSAHTL